MRTPHQIKELIDGLIAFGHRPQYLLTKVRIQSALHMGNNAVSTINLTQQSAALQLDTRHVLSNTATACKRFKNMSKRPELFEQQVIKEIELINTYLLRVFEAFGYRFYNIPNDDSFSSMNSGLLPGVIASHTLDWSKKMETLIGKVIHSYTGILIPAP